MNYYEELGVSPQATEQEIRKAHRRLVKLMHPDAQLDQSLKLMAETQMRRLNSIVSTLLDPEQRRLYDEELRALEAAPSHSGSGLPSWQGIPWWLASAVGAVVLTLIAVWLWADHLGTTFGNRPKTVIIPPVEAHLPEVISPPNSGNGASVGASYLPPVPSRIQPDSIAPGRDDHKDAGTSVRIISEPKPAAGPAPKVQPAQAPKASEKTSVVVVNNNPPVVPVKVPPPPAVKVSETKVQRKADLPAPKLVSSSAAHHSQADAIQETASTKSRKLFTMPANSLMASAAPARTGGSSQLPVPPGVAPQSGRDFATSALPSVALPTPAPPPTVPDAITSATAGSHDPLEGEWVYAPKEPERRRMGFYPPEFINLKLFAAGDPGGLKGQYNAKYVVTDRPVSPEVNFQLASVSRGSRKFVWQSNDGARGTLIVDPIDERTIRIDWHTTSSTRAPALTSGQATLVRRQ